jgi:predicted RNase H-like HicB family nuclease
LLYLEVSSNQGAEGSRRRRVMYYGIAIEKLESNYSAYVPDLPGCVATGAAIEEIEQQIKEAVAFHLDGLQEEGFPIPEPSTLCEYVEACRGSGQAWCIL